MNLDKENLFRALKDEELYASYWGCKFGLHKWLKYKEPKHLKGDYSWEVIVIQEKRCGCCNRVKYTKIGKTRT